MMANEHWFFSCKYMKDEPNLSKEGDLHAGCWPWAVNICKLSFFELGVIPWVRRIF